MMKKKFLIITFLLTGLLCGPKAYSKEDLKISTAFQPNPLAVNQEGLFTVTVLGSTNAPTSPLPEIKGLQIQYKGSRHNIQAINGKVSTYGIHTYAVKAKQTGKYVMPDFDLVINKESHHAPGATLEVTSQLTAVSAKDESKIELTIKVPQGPLYVGQMFPIKIRLFIPEGVRGQILSQPILEDEAFLDYGFPEAPQKKFKTRDGIVYNTMTWKTYLTAIKAGEQALQFKIPLQLIGQSKQSHSLIDEFFRGHGLALGHMLGSNTEQVELSNQAITLNIQAIPPHGAPDNFTGAVGDFILGEASVDSQAVSVGEPITLRVPVVGRGNFNRITPSPLTASSEWKSYPPKTSFKQKDSFGYEGGKYLEYILIPQNDSITQTPQVTFSYFDPNTGQYEELNTKPLPIKVQKNTLTNLNEASPKIINTKSQNQAREAEIGPLMLKISKQHSTLSPYFLRPKVIAGHSFAFALLASSLYCIKRRKKLQQNTAYTIRKHSDKSLGKNLHNLRKAYNQGNPAAFYSAAQNAISESIVHNHTQADAMTRLEMQSILEDKKIPEDLAQQVLTLFMHADNLKFSGTSNTFKITRQSLKETEDLITTLTACLNK